MQQIVIKFTFSRKVFCISTSGGFTLFINACLTILNLCKAGSYYVYYCSMNSTTGLHGINVCYVDSFTIMSVEMCN